MGAVLCPCGATDARQRPRALDACCGPVLAQARLASDAQALMRSRYTAYVLGDVAHLLTTWHPSTRPTDLSLEPSARWLGLEVKRHERLDGAHERVCFVARYREGGKGHALRECSRFVREDDQWFYVDGDVS
jgi:SEC-C motif domain protein